MASDLEPQQFESASGTKPGDPTIAWDHIQGDVLLGLQKCFERFVFFEIKDGGGIKSAARHQLVQRMMTTHPQTMDEPVSNHPTGNVRSTLNEPQDFIIPTADGVFLRSVDRGPARRAFRMSRISTRSSAALTVDTSRLPAGEPAHTTLGSIPSRWVALGARYRISVAMSIELQGRWFALLLRFGLAGGSLRLASGSWFQSRWTVSPNWFRREGL